MKRSTKSLLEELNSVAKKRDQEAIIENRASHLINSAVNLLTLIKESFTPEEADELERRLFSSLRSGNPAKFNRGIRRIRDSKSKNSTLSQIDSNSTEE